MIPLSPGWLCRCPRHSGLHPSLSARLWPGVTSLRMPAQTARVNSPARVCGHTRTRTHTRMCRCAHSHPRTPSPPPPHPSRRALTLGLKRDSCPGRGGRATSRPALGFGVSGLGHSTRRELGARGTSVSPLEPRQCPPAARASGGGAALTRLLVPEALTGWTPHTGDPWCAWPSSHRPRVCGGGAVAPCCAEPSPR